MKNLSIDQLDKLRNQLIFWFLIGYVFFFGGYILSDITNNFIVILILAICSFVGYLLFVVNLLRIMKLSKELKRNTKIATTLNDELWKSNRDKAFITGFIISILTLVILYCVTLFYPLEGRKVCEVMMLVSVSAVLILFLIYNRE